MRKNNQKGFSAVETVLVLVIVGLIAFIAWYVFKSRSDTDTTLSNAANTQTEVPNNTTNAAVVVTKTDSKGSKYLADTKSATLYTYSSDTAGVSNCTGDCLTAWPIYKAATTTNLPDNITVIKRSDGTSQYAYNGMPLYFYSSDSIGKVTGDGISGFKVATP